MLKTQFDEMLRLFYSRITGSDEFTKDDYNASFTDGEKKGKEVLKFLADVNADPSRLAYISIGGADGAEVFHVLENSAIQKAIILEYDSEFCRYIRNKNNLNIEVLEGDAWGHRQKCVEIINKWLNEGLISGVVISAFSVLHELPYRSDKNYNFLQFLSTIVGSAGEAYFYTKEPSTIIEWNGRVKLAIPEWFSPHELFRFSKTVHDNFKSFFDTLKFNEIIEQSDGVIMDAQLAGEVVRKILYFLANKSVDRLVYELGECHAALDPVRLASDVSKVFKKDGQFFLSRVEKQTTSSQTLNHLYRTNKIGISFWDAEKDTDGWIPTGFVKIGAYFRKREIATGNHDKAAEQLFEIIDKKVKDDEFFAKRLAQYEKRAVSGELLEDILKELLDDIEYLKSNSTSENYGLLQQYVGRLMIMTSVSDPLIHTGSIIPFGESREFIDRSIKIVSPSNQLESFWLSALTFREAKDWESMKSYCEIILAKSNSNAAKTKYRLFAARELAILQYGKGDSLSEVSKTLGIIEERLEDIIVNPNDYSYNNYEAVEKVITMWAYLDLTLKTMNIEKAEKFYELINLKIDFPKLLNKLHKVMVSDFYRSLYMYHLIKNNQSKAKYFYSLHEKLCKKYKLLNSMNWINNITRKFEGYLL